jgi:sulfatase maturation enzyme AslB (radical SAM superfamily)
VDELKNILEQKYNIACYVLLEDLSTQSSSTFYRELNKHVREAYQHNDRFVLLNFNPVKIDLLNHVNKTIQYLDISPHFILVVSNQPATKSFFESLPEPICVEHADIIVEPTMGNVTPLFNTNNTMCAHAWAGLHLEPDGETKVCCNYVGFIRDDVDKPHNINKHSYSEVLNSSYMKNIRKQWQHGIVPHGCLKCVGEENSGGITKKSLSPYKLNNIYGEIDWESDVVDLKYLGANLGNLCNLKCRICRPIYSSTIAAEELAQVPAAELKSHPVYIRQTTTRWATKSDDFWDNLKSELPEVRNFEFLGGEPLMLKENIEFMEYLVDSGNSKDAVFEFITNGTQFPKVFDRANEFKRLTITLSIDDIGKRAEFQRSNLVWTELRENIRRYVAAKNSTTSMSVNACVTVNIQNVYYLPELITWLKQQDINDYFYNILHYSPFLAVNRLTPRAKELVLDKLTNCGLVGQDGQRLEYVINTVKAAETSDGREFIEYMKDKDRIRGENFAAAHPEIAAAMGYDL